MAMAFRRARGVTQFPTRSYTIEKKRVRVHLAIASSARLFGESSSARFLHIAAAHP
jgi:hypothetical protein